MDCWTSVILITCFIIQGVDITWSDLDGALVCREVGWVDGGGTRDPQEADVPLTSTVVVLAEPMCELCFSSWKNLSIRLVSLVWFRGLEKFIFGGGGGGGCGGC